MREIPRGREWIETPQGGEIRERREGATIPSYMNDVYGIGRSGQQERPVRYQLYRVDDVSITAMSPREQRAPITEAEEDRQLNVLRMRPERLDSPSFDYNCHGWTFLYGRGWLDNTGNVVDRIIEKGGFQRINSGEPGAIVLYRDLSSGTVRHSGTMDDGTTVVSKWDDGSLFRHNVHEVPENYRGQIEYYRPPAHWRSLEQVREVEL